MVRPALYAAALLAAASSAAAAHTGPGAMGSVAHGLGHPFGGLDHLVVAAAAGLYATRLGGQALWLVPASFVAAMVAGAALAIGGMALPLVETAIAISVVAAGLALAGRRHLPAAVAAGLAAIFALFHGHAHGSEASGMGSAADFVAGLALATLALHALGIGSGLIAARIAEPVRAGALRLTGGAIAFVGVVLLAGSW